MAIPEGEKIGRLEIEPRMGNKNRAKKDALVFAKIEACAVNATTIYIVREKFTDDNPSKPYACIIDMYRETHRNSFVPEFVRTAQAEAKTAKEQRERMNEVKGKIADTIALATHSVNVDSIAMTSLRRYAPADSLATAQLADNTVELTTEAAADTFAVSRRDAQPPKEKRKLEKGIFATVGHHYAGATVAGLELEFAISRIGVFGGAGVYGFGGGVNIHVKPDPLSSYVSCLYWKNGIGDTYRQSAVGASYNYRGKRWLSMQIGLGKIVDRGPEFSNFNKDFLLLYSIGAFVPF